MHQSTLQLRPAQPVHVFAFFVFSTEAISSRMSWLSVITFIAADVLYAVYIGCYRVSLAVTEAAGLNVVRCPLATLEGHALPWRHTASMQLCLRLSVGVEVLSAWYWIRSMPRRL